MLNCGSEPTFAMRSAPSVLVLFLAACGPTSSLAPVSPAGATCSVLMADHLTDTVVVGVHEPVDFSHAPVPETEAERFVFATFYETLVRLDCEGRMEPGLAVEWSRVEDDGRRWRFTLRDDARFWDGTPVLAEDVVAAWTDRGGVPAESLIVLDARTLSVMLAHPETAAPRLFADPRLAIAKPGARGAPPLGSRPYAIGTWTAGRLDARAAGATGPVLRFLLSAGADPRDLLDQGADLLVTDDPATLAYAESQDAVDVTPLPWAWTYVFVGQSIVTSDPASLAEQLARDAVRADVRVAEPPFWWPDAPRCTGFGAPFRPPTPGAARRIVYPAADAIARDIAGRLVALAAAGQAFQGAGKLTAVALVPVALAEALAANTEFGYVTALPRRSYGACLELPAGAVVPLLDARNSLVAKRGRASVELEWDGTPRLVRP